MTDSIDTTALGPGLLAVTPGTDFVTFATGGGANIEDMPSYLADPQRGTGNLPGLARSNFNNRAIRQGTFVASGVSTFIWQVLSIYVPDDGNLDNWVANFKAALQSYITPGGTLPGGPYLPIAGGTMQGNINFQAGSTVVLPNNTYLRGFDVGGTAHGLIRYGSDGNVQISDGAAPLVSFGSTPTIGSGTYWSARDTGGTVHGLLGIPSDNNTYLNAFNNLYVTASTAWFNCNVVVPNNALYYGKNTAAAPVALLGVGNDNITRLAQGAPSETWIYAAAGARVVLNAAVTVVGTLSPAGTVAIGGALTVAGNTGLSGSLQVNGASNLYARLNVNNSVGATITGDIATNSIHIFGGGITVDQNATISGQTNIQSCQIYIPGGNDPLTIAADVGHYARIRYSVANTRLWSAGAFYDGTYRIADESAGQIRFTIDTSGNTTVGGGGLWSPYLRSYGHLQVDQNLYIGTAGYYIFYSGGGFIGIAGNLSVGQINSSGDIYTNSIHTAYHAYVQGVVQFSGATNMYWWGGAGYVRIDSGFWSQGYFVANQGAQVSNGDLNVYGNSWTRGGGIYALDAGIVVGPYGVVTDGNIRMNGGGPQGGGNQLTMRNGYDGGRPYSVHVNGDWWRVAEAYYDGVSGIEPYAAIDWFAVINPGILVLSGGNAWKQGGGMWADTSERRFKEDITSFDGGLAEVLRIRPRRYKFNGQANTTANGRHYVGLIADEVEDIFPDMLWLLDVPIGLRYGKIVKEKVTTLDPTTLFYALVNAVKELAARVEQLEGGKA